MAIPSSGPLSFANIQTEFGGSNPIGLNEYYAGGAYVAAGTTGTNGAVPSSGELPINKFYGTSAEIVGQAEYTWGANSSATYTWIAPAGVTSVSVIVIAYGGWGQEAFSYRCCVCCVPYGPVYYVAGTGGGGGGLAYRNNIPVTPGNGYTVSFNANGGEKQYFNAVTNTGTSVVASNGIEGCAGGGGGYFFYGTSGNNGGAGGRQLVATGGYTNARAGGGGSAGGYSNVGAAGGGTTTTTNGANGSGGAGGGGAASVGSGVGGGGGGGTGNLGEGASGTGGVATSGNSGGGTGGSGGGSGSAGTTLLAGKGGIGGQYGGGGGGHGSPQGSIQLGRRGFPTVRIIWPGTTRYFPSTRTGNL